VPLTAVFAPDSFKGSLGAGDVAAAIAEGWRTVRSADKLVLLPQADGGEGTLDAIAAAVPAALRRSAGTVTGPDGRGVEGEWLDIPDGTAIVELATSSGFSLMAAPDPMGATTRGLGEVIAAALDAGARAITIGLGGSASTDGGAGALKVLGLGLTDPDGLDIPPGGRGLAQLAAVDRSLLRPAPLGGVRLLSDVTAPLLGPEGAATVFAPQKGASPDQVMALDAALARFADLVGGDPGIAGAGAAGGTGFGLLAAWGAEIVAGSAAISELTGLPAATGAADVVILGEGRFDATSSTGKVVGHGLALVDRGSARPVVIAGSLAANPVTPAGCPAWSASLVDLAGSLDAALADPARWLRAAGAAAARAITAE
jgi:glycerate kinase